MSNNIIGVRFQKIGKLYHFNAAGFDDIQPGDFAVVHTSRGKQLGQVIGIVDNPPKPPKGTWKRIERKATPNDLLMKQTLEQKALEVLIQCRAQASESELEGLKIAKADYSFDGKSLTILYNMEEEGEVDLAPLRKYLKETLPDVSVDFRRIGPRDVAKIIGGMGACGMETRCCSTFLTEFCPISIKMAKAQSVSLDPSEITGMCGRLRCCLIYEFEHYVEARKELPKRGKRVITPMGEGKVIKSEPLKQTVFVRLADSDKPTAEFHKDEIEPWKELKDIRNKSQQSSGKHKGEGRKGNKKPPQKKIR